MSGRDPCQWCGSTAHPPEDCHTHRVPAVFSKALPPLTRTAGTWDPSEAPPSVPTLNVAEMLRRTAELQLERATHDARRAKAEADMAELLLERARAVQARMALPDLGRGGSS